MGAVMFRWWLVGLVVATALCTDNFCYSGRQLANDTPCRFYAAVIDAGSTGTRLHLYKFLHSPETDGLPIVVEQEIFLEVKPGLSSFTEEPRGAADSVRVLINHAREVVPHFMWEKTPIALKATAGLRLLPNNKAGEIMSHVRDEVFDSGFFAIPDAVSILSGSDEGIYSWLTLNLLLNAFTFESAQQLSRSHKIAAFDLGGGSTQVTFLPDERDVFEVHPQYERSLNFFDNEMNLFTHSFLGNGLVSARFGVLSRSTSDSDQHKKRLATACLPADYSISQWEYILEKYEVHGNETYSFENCYETVHAFVEHSKIIKLGLEDHSLYFFSYFFDRALNAGLVKDVHGGTIKLKQYKEAAQKACQRTAKNLEEGAHWLPWQCLDLTYIYSLLHDGYGFKDEQELKLVKKIQKMEVAWAQGLSYDVVTQFRASENVTYGTKNGTVAGQLWDYITYGTTSFLEYFNLVS